LRAESVYQLHLSIEPLVVAVQGKSLPIFEKLREFDPLPLPPSLSTAISNFVESGFLTNFAR
jgi:hypothetical protein